MSSPQSLSEEHRRLVAAWAAQCAERSLTRFEAEAPEDSRARDGIARAWAYSRGELDTAGEIRRRFEAGRAAHSATSPAGAAAARAAGQASGVAHMGAHALGAAAYAAKSAELADPGRGGEAELIWQLGCLTLAVSDALAGLPSLGEDSSGPLGKGLLATGFLGDHIRLLQAAIRRVGTAPTPHSVGVQPAP